MEFQFLDSKHYAQDQSINEGNKVLQLCSFQEEAFSKVGRELDMGDDIEELLKQSGFQNVTHRRQPVPLGAWPKEKTLVWNYREQEYVLLTSSHRKGSVYFGFVSSKKDLRALPLNRYVKY